MDELKIFEKDEFLRIKDFQKEKPNAVMGIVYAIEYGDGFSKIGMSSVPANRTLTLKHYISDYMQYPVNRIMITTWHTNYRQNEKKLHKEFSDCRIPNTELFSVNVQEIVDSIKRGTICFEDKSAEMLDEIKRGSKYLIEFGKSVMRGDYDTHKASVNEFEKMYDQMLEKSDSLTEEAVFTARSLVDSYRESLEDNMEKELNTLKRYFVDKWAAYGLL